MCGFIGLFGDSSNTSLKKIIQMSHLLNHRGPDNESFHYFSLDKNINYSFQKDNFRKEESSLDGYFAFNRLSIQDLSPKANQPMISNSGSVVIVFNGEIYNTVYLKEILLKKGCTFKTTSDTEILLYLYLEFGLDVALEMIDGMYAFSIVDLRNKTISIIRDHAGIKPLYYYFKNNNLIFSSELKVFNCIKELNWELNYEKFSEQILFRNIVGQETLVRNIYQLIPGSYKIFSFSENSIKQKIEKTFYNFPEFKQWNKYNKNKVFDLESKFKQIVYSQLVSDVPLGAQLSGGIDSSLVTFFASENKSDIETFSINVNDLNLSEEKYINYVNNIINCKSNIYEISDNEYIDKFDRVTYFLDHPIHHPNTIGLYYLAKYS